MKNLVREQEFLLLAFEEARDRDVAWQSYQCGKPDGLLLGIFDRLSKSH